MIFLAGRHIVEYDIIRKKQSFIAKSIDDESVTAIGFYKKKNNELKIGVALKSTAQTLPLVIRNLR